MMEAQEVLQVGSNWHGMATRDRVVPYRSHSHLSTESMEAAKTSERDLDPLELSGDNNHRIPIAR